MADISSASDLPVSLSAVPPTAFTYVAEGGANLVAAYTGDDDNDVLRGTVLRIRKKAHDAAVLSDTTLREEDASVAFTDRVVVPLLPPRSTPKLVSVPIHDKEWLKELAKHLQAERPTARRAVDDIDVDREYVVLADNLVGTAAAADTIQLAVEIKPKWGFLPNPTFLSDMSRPIKTNHCRFCLHRLHKTHHSSETAHSTPKNSGSEEYCPLELYSQDRDRVLKALKALVRGWEQTNGKGNNLKLFFEGKMVIPSQNTGFLGDLEDTEQSLPNLLVDFMTSSPLLPRLAHLQSTLDPVDIEGLNALLQAQKGIDLLDVGEDSLTDTLGGEVTLEEYAEFVTSYLTNEAATHEHEDAKLIKSDTSSETSASKKAAAATFLNEKSSIRNLVIAYLLSASFKDCSIMIKISQHPPSELSSERKLEACLVDVDFKSIKRLSRYANLDRDLVRNFESFRDKGGRIESCKV